MTAPKHRTREQESHCWRITIAGGVAQVLRFPGKVGRQEVEWIWPGAMIEPTGERLPHKRRIREREF